jgi:hypothetical protein
MASTKRPKKPSARPRKPAKSPKKRTAQPTAKPTKPAAKSTKGPAKPARARPASPSPAPKLKGSAGPRILKDLGLTDAELFAFLPPAAPKWIRGVFWCQFECDRTLEELMQHFAGRYDVTLGTWPKFPEGAPPDGIPVRQLSLRPKGKYVAYTFYGMRGERYVEDGSLQLEVSFRESGTDWGSNRAVYERFKALELPGIGAHKIVELTD